MDLYKGPANIDKVIIKRKRMNGGAEYGFEIPSLYEFRGDRFPCVRTRILLSDSNKESHKLEINVNMKI